MICLSKKSFICFRPFLFCFSLYIETSLRGHVKHDIRHGIVTNNIRQIKLDFSMLAHDQSAELFDLVKVVQQDSFLVDFSSFEIYGAILHKAAPFPTSFQATK